MLASLASAAPQGGYTKEKHPELGLELSRARDYEAIPLQPGESWRLLYYAEKESKTKKKGRRFRPLYFIVRIDWVDDPEPTAKTPPPLPDPDQEGRTTAEPMEKAEEDEAPPPINSFERYLEQELDGWELGRPVKGKERDGYVGTEYPLLRAKTSTAGWAYTYCVPNRRTYAVVGFCHERDLKEQSKIWRYTAEHMRFSEPVGENKDLGKLERYYARKPFRDPAYRIAVRGRLVSGWKADDTENYIVVYDTKDQPLIRRILREIEAVRGEYLKLFPPTREIEAVSTLRVCKSREEYMAFGGSAGSAGYWNSATEELVMYDAAVQHGARSIDTDTFIVLYHEAFHQYIHYSAGELAPHSWFNEGHGDYFSGAKIKSGKVRSIGINPWRIRAIQHFVRKRDHEPWKDIIAYEQAEFYQPARRGKCYAQGWSMIYFLRKSKEVARNPEWSGILETYFETLKQVFGSELALLEKQNRLNDREKQAASKRAREKAVEVAFEGVNLALLEDEWIEFTMNLDAD